MFSRNYFTIAERIPRDNKPFGKARQNVVALGSIPHQSSWRYWKNPSKFNYAGLIDF